MDEAAPHPFDSLYAKRPDFAALNEGRWEASRVEFLLRATTAQAHQTAAVRKAWRAASALGRPGLDWPAFREAYPDFPTFLGCSRLGGLALHTHPKMFLPDLLDRFAQTPLYLAWLEFYNTAVQVAGGCPVGLVVPRKGVRHGMIVVGPKDPVSGTPGGALVYVPKTGDHPPCTVRSFQAFAAGLRWRPDLD